MNRVCFISIYWGPIPNFFKTFFDSCKWNMDFDWLIVHDHPIPYKYPNNVKTLNMDLLFFRELVNKKLGIIVPDFPPYKVCDLRPAFGILFDEYLKEYEFWGICDTDLLLGNLNKFITENILNTYDKIFTMGHMTLVRNNKACNNLFKEETINSRDYLAVFLKNKNCIYDEYLGFTEKFCDKGYKVYKKKVCADVAIAAGRMRIHEKWLIKCIQPNNSFLKFVNDKNYKYQLFIVYKGKIYRVYINKHKQITQEYSYIHKIEYSYNKELSEQDTLLITTKGYIFDKSLIEKFENNKLTKADIDQYNRMNNFGELCNNIYLYMLWKYRRIKNILTGKAKE